MLIYFIWNKTLISLACSYDAKSILNSRHSSLEEVFKSSQHTVRFGSENFHFTIQKTPQNNKVNIIEQPKKKRYTCVQETIQFFSSITPKEAWQERKNMQRTVRACKKPS